MFVSISSISKYEGQEVELRGWLYNKRKSGAVVFLLIRDGTGTIQAVAEREVLADPIFEQLKGLGQESSLVVLGVVRADARAPGGWELRIRDARVLQDAHDYPITKKNHGHPFLFDHRHLWLRSRRQQAILRVRHHAIRAIRDYLDDHGFVLLDSPILTPNACEGTSTLFATEYFGRMAYLTQSGQLYQEAGAAAFGRTYCFGPTFRAEKSDTRRHLTEFWMVEPEVAFMNFDELFELLEDFVVEVVGRTVERSREQLAVLERDLAPLERVQKPFPRISYDEACARIRSLGVEMADEDDFGAPQETALAESFDRPVMVHRYPRAVKAFYMKVDPERPDRALGIDLLAPEGYGEIIGAGQREDDLEELLAQIRRHQLPESAFQWYLDLRRYGTFPHCGFGMGLERFVAWICGLQHVREACPFPRTVDRLEP